MNRSPATILTIRQQRFVEEYLVDLNATQAATRVGDSARTANEQGARLLAKASVAVAVEAAQTARGKRMQVTQDDVIQGLRREAMLTGLGSSHPARVSAVGILGKHLDMFTERTQRTGAIGEPIDNRPNVRRSALVGLLDRCARAAATGPAAVRISPNRRSTVHRGNRLGRARGGAFSAIEVAIW